MPPIVWANLKGRYQVGPLANRHRNGFARIPFVLENALHPLRRGDQPRRLGGQVDARARPQAQALGEVIDLVDAQHLSHGVKEHVARFADGLVDVYGAVNWTFSKDPVVIEMSVNSNGTCAVHDVARG